MRALVIGLVVGLWCGVAWGQEIPHFDPEAFCDSAYRLSQSDKAAARHVCIEDEQDSYERLKEDWQIASPEQKVEALSASGGAPHYGFTRRHLEAIMSRDESLRRLREQQEENHFKFN